MISQKFGLGDISTWALQSICTWLRLSSKSQIPTFAEIRLCKLKDHWKSIFETGAPSPSYVESAIDTMVNQCEALIARFFTKNCTAPAHTPANR
jgi:hypothetical protein